jgi:Holliday junction resolvasome RuvABC endonuclease subunit
MALRVAADTHKLPVAMVSANRAKQVVAGYSRADKKRVRNCIRGRYPHLASRSFNEHIYDAYAIALTYIHEPDRKH